jgi:hypothetical protein
VVDEDAGPALVAALRVTQCVRDLQLLTTPVLATDLRRIEDRALHLLARLGVEGPDVLVGEVAVIDAIWERAGVRLDDADREALEVDLDALRSAVEEGHAGAIAAAVITLREHLAGAQVRLAQRRAIAAD